MTAAPGPGNAPHPVARPVMIQGWEALTFLHWRVDADVVARRLPADLQAETCEGSAWVGLVPFVMTVTVPGVPPVPWLSRFCETNVRTYVRDGQGRSGVWFFSLDAARLGAVLVARTTYAMPYMWSRMRLTGDGPTVRYECRRRWPGPRGASSVVAVEVGERYRADELGDLDHFLTARWLLFSRSRSGRRGRFARAWHAPWPLYRARAVEVDDELVAATGLPQPADPPLVHYSPGVAVRIGLPERS